MLFSAKRTFQFLWNTTIGINNTNQCQGSIGSDTIFVPSNLKAHSATPSFYFHPCVWGTIGGRFLFQKIWFILFKSFKHELRSHPSHDVLGLNLLFLHLFTILFFFLFHHEFAAKLVDLLATGLCLQEWSKDEWSLGKCDDSAKGLGGFWKAKVTCEGDWVRLELVKVLGVTSYWNRKIDRGSI